MLSADGVTAGLGWYVSFERYVKPAPIVSVSFTSCALYWMSVAISEKTFVIAFSSVPALTKPASVLEIEYMSVLIRLLPEAMPYPMA